MSKIELSAEQGRFIDDLAELLYPWGMQPGVARLYGFLLLQAEPMGLDAICEALEISKSTASVTARQLEQAKMVRRHAVRGSKRVLYSAANDYSANVADQALMLGNYAALLQDATAVAGDDVVKERLGRAAAFYSTMQGVMQDAIRKFGGD